MDAEDGRRPRPQTYQLRGKVTYVRAGDRFVAGASILAGTPARRAQLSTYRQNTYDPLAHLNAVNTVDRYAAMKSLPFRADLRSAAVVAIERRLDEETDTVCWKPPAPAPLSGRQKRLKSSQHCCGARSVQIFGWRPCLSSPSCAHREAVQF